MPAKTWREMTSDDSRAQRNSLRCNKHTSSIPGSMNRPRSCLEDESWREDSTSAAFPAWQFIACQPIKTCFRVSSDIYLTNYQQCSCKKRSVYLKTMIQWWRGRCGNLQHDITLLYNGENRWCLSAQHQYLQRTLKSTSVSVCFRGISRLPSAFVFLRWFKLAHISIQVCTFHDGCKQRIDQQIFNRKSISRKITHPQSWKLQAKLTGEKLKGWSNSREKTNSRLQSNKTKSTFFLLLDGSKIFSLLPSHEKSKLFSGFSTFQTFQESMARRDSLSLSATLKSTSVSVSWKVHTWIEIYASLNHRKKAKADGSRLIPRKHTETLVLLSVADRERESRRAMLSWNVWNVLKPEKSLLFS